MRVMLDGEVSSWKIFSTALICILMKCTTPVVLIIAELCPIPVLTHFSFCNFSLEIWISPLLTNKTLWATFICHELRSTSKIHVCTGSF